VAKRELDWAKDVLPVLEGVYEVWTDDPQPEGGVSFDQVNAVLGREADDYSTQLVFMQLVDAGYLKPGPFGPRNGPGPGGPSSVLLAEKALQRVASWPSTDGAALYAAMLAEVDRRLASAEVTEDERSKLERLRDFMTGVGRDVLGA
jgi:hypothetical protein